MCLNDKEISDYNNDYCIDMLFSIIGMNNDGSTEII